ncbi:MAG: hypothetical protein P8176_13625 [Gammaproteobacteria bacterium]
MGFIETIIAGVIIAAISGTGGYVINKSITKKKVEALPHKWVNRISALIDEALNEGSEKAIINAKAIVASRDSMRTSLTTLSDSLNSEIDTLAEILGNEVEKSKRWKRGEESKVNVERVWQQLQVLQKYWGMKSDQIENAIRKVMVEIGVDKI